MTARKTKKPAAVDNLKQFHIITLDGSGSFHFFTEAANHKKALRNLEKNSSDYKKIVKSDADLPISIKKIK